MSTRNKVRDGPTSSNLGSFVEPMDLEIIRALQEDARSSFRDVARRLGVAVGTVQSRVKKLQTAKIIRNFSVDLDFGKLGYSLIAVIMCQVGGKHLRDVELKLSRIDNVCVVYDITGDFDVAMVAKFRDPTEMDRFIKEVLSMDYVERTVTSIVLNNVKENYNIPIRETKRK